jgi:hypothetical protein
LLARRHDNDAGRIARKPPLSPVAVASARRKQHRLNEKLMAEVLTPYQGKIIAAMRFNQGRPCSPSTVHDRWAADSWPCGRAQFAPGTLASVGAPLTMVASSFELWCDNCGPYCDRSQYPRTCRIMYQSKGPDIDTVTVAGK